MDSSKPTVTQTVLVEPQETRNQAKSSEYGKDILVTKWEQGREEGNKK